MDATIRFIAITVHDLKQAERFYQDVFEMDLIGREALLDDGLWYSLPHGKGWQEVEAANIDLGMLALRRGDIVLVIFKGEAVIGQVHVVGISLPGEEISRVREKLPPGTEILEEGGDYLSFLDPYRITWQVSAPGFEFQTSGDFSGRWLQV